MQGRRRGALVVRRPLGWLGATSLLVLILDQSSKHIVTARLALNSTVVVIRGVFDIVRVENTGAAFGLLPGQQYLFIGISLLMLLGVGVYWHRERPTAWPEVIALGLVVGGAVGNLIDRVLIGRVTDFLAFRFFSAVFNIADSAIVTGVAALIVWMFFGQTGQAPAESDMEEACPPLGANATKGVTSATLPRAESQSDACGPRSEGCEDAAEAAARPPDMLS